MKKPLIERVEERLRPGANGCLVWTGKVSDRGYGLFKVKARDTKIHRIVWAHHHGEIPGGYHIHHECRNRLCGNISHLRLVTPAEHNALDAPFRPPRKPGSRSPRTLATHCKQGHAYEGDNVAYAKNGTRRCRACARERERRARERQRAAALAEGRVYLKQCEINARKTHCPHGHEYTPENTIVRGGYHGRQCKTCLRAYRNRREREKRAQKRLAAAADPVLE
jgi:hypothetical protein